MKQWRQDANWKLLMGTLLSATLTSCMAQYEPPKSTEPHAVIKFRRSYEQTPGTVLNEQLAVDGQWAFRQKTASRDVAPSSTDAVLVRPGELLVEAQSVFSHTESRQRMQSYQCGTTDAPRTCTRTVHEQVTVVDGRCEQELGLRIVEGVRYLLQVNYQDGRNCSLSCFTQTAFGDGEFKNTHCDRVASLED